MPHITTHSGGAERPRHQTEDDGIGAAPEPGPDADRPRRPRREHGTLVEVAAGAAPVCPWGERAAER